MPYKLLLSSADMPYGNGLLSGKAFKFFPVFKHLFISGDRIDIKLKEFIYFVPVDKIGILFQIRLKLILGKAAGAAEGKSTGVEEKIAVIRQKPLSISVSVEEGFEDVGFPSFDRYIESPPIFFFSENGITPAMYIFMRYLVKAPPYSIGAMYVGKIVFPARNSRIAKAPSKCLYR